MAYPESSQVSGGDTAYASQYNNLRSDALYPVLQSFTYGESISVNDALYLKASDGKVYKTDADYHDWRIYNFIGFAKESGSANDVKKVQIGGKVEGFTGLTTGSYYYLSNTAGAISTSPGTFMALAGLAVSSTELILMKQRIIPVLTFASDELKHANDTERSTTSEGYVKLKEIKVNEGFLHEVRIYFDLRASYYASPYEPAYGRIYRNGVAIGTERTKTSDNEEWATFSEDFTDAFKKGDLIQLYARRISNGHITAYVRNFRLCYTVVPLELPFYTNQDP